MSFSSPGEGHVGLVPREEGVPTSDRDAAENTDPDGVHPAAPAPFGLSFPHRYLQILMNSPAHQKFIFIQPAPGQTANREIFRDN